MEQNIQTALQPKRGISGSTIKMIAIVAMLIDHIAAFVLERMIIQGVVSQHRILALNSYFAMRLIGRFGFPIFCFLLVEGFMHTRSKAKYAFRLFLFSLISEIPFDLAFQDTWFYIDYQNVFFTLLIGFIMMVGFAQAKKITLPQLARWLIRPIAVLVSAFYLGVLFVNLILIPLNVDESHYNQLFLIFFAIMCVLLFVSLTFFAQKYDRETEQIVGMDMAILFLSMTIADLLKTDYAGFGVLTIAVMYFFRHHRFRSMLAGCIALTIMEPMEIASFLMLIPISKYNGKRGWNIKYVFYAFYPVHLMLLYLVCVWLKLV